MSGETRCDNRRTGYECACGHRRQDHETFTTKCGVAVHGIHCGCMEFRPASPPPAVTGEALDEGWWVGLQRAARIGREFTAEEGAALVAEVARLRASGTDERLREAVRQFIDCHDSGDFQSEGQAIDALRASLPSERAPR